MYLPTDVHLGLSQHLAVTSTVAMNIYIHVFIKTHAFISLVEIPVGEMARPRGRFMFNLLRNYQIVLESGCTILQSDQFQFLYILSNTWCCQYF